MKITSFAPLLLALVSAPVHADPKLGAWGEDPRVVPDFAPKEERRAPKIPEGDTLWEKLQAPRAWDRIDDALLVCHLLVGQHQDGVQRGVRAAVSFGITELGHASPTLRFQIGKQPTIVSFAPQWHDESFVSIPALAMTKGDRLKLTLSDRRVLGDRPMGSGTLVWSGASPFVIASPTWKATCVLADAAEARTAAQPWLASLDRQLDKLLTLHPDRAAPRLGRPDRALDQLRGPFKELFTHEGNFRYAAGFVGWGAPEIVERVERLRTWERAWDDEAAKEISSLRASLSPQPIVIEGTTLQVTTRGPKLATRVELASELKCTELLAQLDLIELVDARGRFHAAQPDVTDARGHHCSLSTMGDPSLHGPLMGTLGSEENASSPLVLVHTRAGWVRPGDSD